MQFVTLDVFTDTPFRGNPLAVVVVQDKDRAVLDKADDADDADIKQLIANEFNLSETVFLYLHPHETLSSPDRSSNEREMRIYTIESELPFAGHPTIGTAYLLRQHLGWHFVDTIIPPAGPIRLTSASDGAVTAAIPHDVHLHSRTLRSLYELGDKEMTAQIQPALHDEEAVRNAELDAPIFSIVKGMTFLLVELPTIDLLAKVSVAKRLDLENYVSLLDAGPWGHGFTARYYYVRQTVAAAEDGTRTETIRARMVELGFEDPATGSAASSLACHLALGGDVGKVRYRITQGVEMGRTSEIEVSVVSADRGDSGRLVKEVKLGGTARVVMTGDIAV